MLENWTQNIVIIIGILQLRILSFQIRSICFLDIIIGIWMVIIIIDFHLLLWFHFAFHHGLLSLDFLI
jgi:hypothetical protein